MKLFSKEHKKNKDNEITLKISKNDRLRISRLFGDVILYEAMCFLLDKKGSLIYDGSNNGEKYKRSIESNKMAMAEQRKYFIGCPNDDCIDCIQTLVSKFWVRDSTKYRKKDKNKTLRDRKNLAKKINKIFEEYDIGFEIICNECVEVIIKENTFIHTIINKPVLDLLNGKKFEIINKELMDAYGHCKKGEWSDCILDCGKAFESTLKLICKEKKWEYNKDKDTLSRLLEICKSNGLFYDFCISSFVGIATIRNRLGGHGEDPDPNYVADKSYAFYTIGHVSSLIYLFIKKGEIE